MDLKQYFRKFREIENGLTDPFPFVVSLETSDGGKAGVVSEVSREMAAKLIVEGRAVVASEEEKQIFLANLDLKRKAAEKAELSRRVQVAIIADPDFQTSVINKRQTVPGNGK